MQLGQNVPIQFPFLRSWHNYISYKENEMTNLVRSVRNAALLIAGQVGTVSQLAPRQLCRLEPTRILNFEVGFV
jgi:hypothetical protein